MQHAERGTVAHQPGAGRAPEAEDKWVIYETAFGFRIWLNLFEEAICLKILRDRYEPVETALVQNTVEENGCVLDIGANIGYFTMLLAKLVGPNGHVYSYEPIPHLHEKLAASVAENSFSHVHLNECALSNENGRFSMIYLPHARNAGGSFLNTQNESLKGHGTLEVQTRKLDDLEFPDTISFIKMDAEGAEVNIIRGGERLLTAEHPKILSEIHPAQLLRVSNATADDFIRQMAQYGYKCANVLAPDVEIDAWGSDTIGNVLFY